MPVMDRADVLGTEIWYRGHFSINLDLPLTELEVMSAVGKKNGWDLPCVIRHSMRKGLPHVIDVAFNDDEKNRLKYRKLLGLTD